MNFNYFWYCKYMLRPRGSRNTLSSMRTKKSENSTNAMAPATIIMMLRNWYEYELRQRGMHDCTNKAASAQLMRIEPMSVSTRPIACTVIDTNNDLYVWFFTKIRQQIFNKTLILRNNLIYLSMESKNSEKEIKNLLKGGFYRFSGL